MTWIFDGIGAAIIAAIIGIIFAPRLKSLAQRQSGTGANSTNIQAGRDVHFGSTQLDRDHDVQPIMHLVLNSGEGGPDGHYLNGFIRNVGRGIARHPKVYAPAVAVNFYDELIKPMETIELRGVRYDDTPAFLQLLEDPTVRVEFENEFGTKFEQFGKVEQSRGPHSDVYQYNIKGLGPVQRCN